MKLSSLSTAGVIIFTAVLIPFCSEKKERQPVLSQKPKSILVLGDSLTAGFRLEDGADSFPVLLEKQIEQAGFNDIAVINGGVSGDTTAGGLERSPYYQRPELGIKLVVVALGSNDSMRAVAPAEIRSNLVAIIKSWQAFDPAVKTAIVQMYTFPNIGKEYAEQYALTFGQAAKQTGAQLWPFMLKGVAGKPELNVHDGIHPNTTGTKIVAANLFQQLKKHLPAL